MDGGIEMKDFVPTQETAAEPDMTALNAEMEKAEQELKAALEGVAQ